MGSVDPLGHELAPPLHVLYEDVVYAEVSVVYPNVSWKVASWNRCSLDMFNVITYLISNDNVVNDKDKKKKSRSQAVNILKYCFWLILNAKSKRK